MDETQHLARPGVSASASPVPSRARSCNALLGDLEHQPSLSAVRVVFLLCPLAGMAHRDPRQWQAGAVPTVSLKLSPHRDLALSLVWGWTAGHSVQGQNAVPWPLDVGTCNSWDVCPPHTHTKPGHLWEKHQLPRRSLGNRQAHPGIWFSPQLPTSTLLTDNHGGARMGGEGEKPPHTRGGLLVPV